MDSLLPTKISGAVLGTLLFVMGSGFVAELIYTPKPAGDLGYRLPLPEPKSASGQAAAAAAVEPIAVRLASADPAKGEGGAKACKGCHSFEKGGPNGAGPDLWDIVERKKGGHEGFGYSPAMKEKGGAWTYEDLDHFLESPSGFVKGTKMGFKGISPPNDRANVIAYLRTLSDSPKPLPAADKPAAAKPEGGAKPAEAKPEAAKPKPEDAAKPTEAKPEGGTQPTEAKPEGDAKQAEPKSEGGAKPAEAKPEDDAKPVEPKPEGDAKPTEPKPEGENKPTETKPEGDTKPAEPKPEGETAPAEPKPH